MAIRFVLGRAGTGKTHHCLEAVRKELRRRPEGPPLILLVPEQATFQMERELAATPDLSGFIRAQVISFARLIYRIVEITGGTARARIGELGRRMLLRSLLLQNEEQLRVFGGYARHPGLLERLSRVLGEMRAYAHPPEDLERAAAQLNAKDAFLADKVHDLALLYRLYDRAVSERYLDPDTAMDRATAVLDAAARGGSPFPLLAGACLWVDGFAGFTPQELRLLEALLRQVETAEIALCVEPRLCLDEPPYVRWVPELSATASSGRGFIYEDDSLLFAPTLRTYRDMRLRLEELGLPVAPALRLSAPPFRFRGALPLLRVEREVGGADGPANESKEPVVRSGEPHLAMAAAANRRLEVEAAAWEILRLCREEGHRFRDITVLTWSLEPYHALIESIFSDLRIPYFMDVRRPLVHHPLVELVRSAVETVTSGYAQEPLFRFLKTDLGPVGRESVDRLEEYALQHGLVGSEAWTSATPWSYQRRYTLQLDETFADDARPAPGQQREKGHGQEQEQWAALASLDRLRRLAVRELGILAASMRRLNGTGDGESNGGGTAREYCQALYGFLAALRVEEKLARWAEEARRQGKSAAAREHEEAWPMLVQLLDELVEGLGQERLTLAEFRQVLEAGLAGLSIGLIPPSLDQVLVGSVERSRTPAVRTTLVLGVAEGLFPAVPQEDLLFLDGEREALGQEGLSLADTARTRLLHQRYLSYIALTRPSQRLWVSYPQSDDSGRALVPAGVFRRLLELFPDQPVRHIVSPLQLPPGDLARLAGAVAARLRTTPDPEEAAQVEQWLRIVEADSVGKRILGAVENTNRVPALRPDTVSALYGKACDDRGEVLLRSSVSRLEEFARCPFRHFATFGLKLKEWERPELDSLLWGQFVHAVLERLLRLLKRDIEEGKLGGWDGLTADEALPYLEQAFKEVEAGLARELPSSSQLRFQVRLLHELLQTALPALVRQISGAEFRPLGLEVVFGRSDDSAAGGPTSSRPTIPLPGGGWLELRGRIDRVDAAVVGEDVYVRVIDYKTGSGAGWRLEDVVDGLALQLIVYLLVAVHWAAERTGNTSPARPAGLFFFPVVRRWRKYDTVDKLSAAPEKVAEEWLSQYKLRGLVVYDHPVPLLMDGSMASGGRSRLVPLALTKDGQPYRNSAHQVGDADLQALLTYAEQKAAELAGAIVAGDISISPWSKPRQVACTHCPYHALCWFDRRFPGNSFRYLAKRDDRRLWQQIREVINR